MRIGFVCQAGPLEPKAVLLAASIRAHLEPDIELIAAHPRREGLLSEATIRALSDLDVRILPIRNPLCADYPIGHKLAALKLTAGSSLGVFLDTDMVAMRRPEAWPAVLSMVPAARNQHSRDVWVHAYGAFGLIAPRAKAPSLVTRLDTAPYFNAGMIAAPGDLIGALSAAWIDTAVQLDADDAIPPSSKRPWLDQLSLPIAAARLGHEIEALDRAWNFGGWVFRLADAPTPYFFHYHRWERLREEAEGLAAISDACAHTSVRTALADVLR